MSRPIYFVSLGPGDAELITLKSLHALQQADIIYCPSTVREPDKILSRAATLLHKLGIKGDIHLFSLPMSKDRTKAIKVYRQLFEEMRLEQKAGKRLAVAVEGDAGIYASVHYVLDLLEENGIPVEQLPGIPSFIAAEAAAKLHLISQKERLVIIPGNITSDELDMYLSHHHVPVIMKLSQCADIVQDYMESHHPNCPNLPAMHLRNRAYGQSDYIPMPMTHLPVKKQASEYDDRMCGTFPCKDAERPAPEK